MASTGRRTRSTPRRSIGVVALCAVAITGCSGSTKPPPSPEYSSISGVPSGFLTVIGDPEAALRSIAASTAFFDRSDIVVTAAAGDAGAQVLAASVAVRLGTPLLLIDPASAEALDNELVRLATGVVLEIGDGSGSSTEAAPAGATPPTTVRVSATVDAVEQALDSLTDAPRGETPRQTPTPEEAVTAVATLDGDAPLLLDLAPAAENGGPAPSTPPAAELDLAATTRPAAVVGALMIATDDPANVAGVATARAAGVQVRLTPVDSPNPQASAELVATMAEDAPTAVVALGESFAAESSLDWKVRSAMSGTQLPGGGQLIFPSHLLVALYGHPGAPVLGVLGEQDTEATLERARQTAQSYAALTERTVVPTLEIIASVASAEAGDDGDYSNEVPVEALRPLVEAAGAAGVYVVLDLQPGRTDFLTQAKIYEPLLSLPHVGLALDPEWRLEVDQRHLVQIGSVEASEVNQVVGWLADLTAANALPQKLLVLHQFQNRMVAGRETVDMSRDELALLIHVDGQGSQPAKQDTWRALQVDAPAGIAWGWKNFYDEDTPPLSPEQTMTEVAPVPDLVTYQ